MIMRGQRKSCTAAFGGAQGGGKGKWRESQGQRQRVHVGDCVSPLGVSYLQDGDLPGVEIQLLGVPRLTAGRSLPGSGIRLRSFGRPSAPFQAPHAVVGTRGATAPNNILSGGLRPWPYGPHLPPVASQGRKGWGCARARQVAREHGMCPEARSLINEKGVVRLWL